nr:unnamed protein product [Digitaria exilis]
MPQKPQAATRGDGGSNAGCTWLELYPPWPLCRCRAAAGASLARAGFGLCLSSHTVPDDPDRRNVSLDRCNPAIDEPTSEEYRTSR